MPDPAELTPCITPAGLGIGGRCKTEPEDFLVEEIPAYEPSGTGEHLFLWVQKRDVSSEHLVGHIARSLKISREEVGVAGLKDRWAVTRQWVSVPASSQSEINVINDDSIQVLQSALHGNKLRTGHLKGNRFDLLIRNVPEDAFEIATQIRNLVLERGIPNYFGEQRFGTDGETLQLGLSLLKGEVSPREIPFKRRKFLTRLALSAAQSSLFNSILSRRMRDGSLHQVAAGDVMQVSESGGLFVAEDVPTEQARFLSHETVITGPLFGPKMKAPLGQTLQLEQDILKAAGLSNDVFRLHKKLTPGARRPLLIWLNDLELEPASDGLRIRFSLPSGSYATVVLREFMKPMIPGPPHRNDE